MSGIRFAEDTGGNAIGSEYTHQGFAFTFIVVGSPVPCAFHIVYVFRLKSCFWRRFCHGKHGSVTFRRRSRLVVSVTGITVSGYQYRGLTPRAFTDASDSRTRYAAPSPRFRPARVSSKGLQGLYPDLERIESVQMEF